MSPFGGVPRPIALLLVGIGALGLVGCGSDAAQSAEVVIEEKMSEDLGLGELEASCDQPDEVAEGETFECTGTTEDGVVVEFEAELTGDDEFSVATTNYLTADDLQALLEVIAVSVTEEVGVAVAVSDIECPPAPLLLDENDEMTCEITDPETGETFVFVVETGGLEAGGGPLDLGWRVGDPVAG